MAYHVEKLGISVILGAAWMLGPGCGIQITDQNMPPKLSAPVSAGGTRRPASGNLRRLSFEGKNDHYSLNGVALPKISTHSICLVASDHYRMRIRFLKTVLVSNGEPADKRDADLIRSWSESIPKVAQILKQKDAVGSLKPMIYELVHPTAEGLQIQEQLTLLWSADPAEARNVGHTGFGPLMNFSRPIADVQYRAPNIVPNRLFKKCFLQILYLHENGNRLTLGGFVIVSTPNGEYEIYLVPQGLLDQIIIKEK